MQKQKINLLYLVMQNTYEDIETAIFNDITLLEKESIDKISASKTLVPKIDLLLKKHHFSLEDLTFLGVNKGPGPFTTLRVVITTANALNFAADIPLVGIDGLDAIAQEYKDIVWPITVILLNAYNNDVYYAIQYNDNIEKGWKNIEELLKQLKLQFPDDKVRFIGNAANLFSSLIKEVFGNFEYIQEPTPQTSSIEQIAKMALENWKNKQGIVEQILPVYLKDAVKIKIN